MRQIVNKNNACPSLESRYELDPSQVEQFRTDGHIYLPGVANPEEVDFFRGAINDTAEKYGQTDALPLDQRDTYGKAFLQHMNLWVADGALVT